MKFQFDPNQPYQLDAINAVVDLFEGQSSDLSDIFFELQSVKQELTGQQKLIQERQEEIGAIANRLILDEDAILQNLQHIQDRNGIPVNQKLDGMNFSVEMETGTGKTYVYLRTIFELAQKYHFTKFIILVPSVAIKEGVAQSIRDTTEHFRQLYAQPFDWAVYDGKSPESVQQFATSTSIQIMIMTIQSVKGDKNTRVIHQSRDKLTGIPPIEYLSAAQPIIIMDEPQNMESQLSDTAITDLNPLCTLRYSATHKKKYNQVYSLDPINAHELKLVKQIVVADVLQQGADAKPYMKLLDVKRDPWRAKMELAVKTASGIVRKAVTLKQGDDLYKASNNEAYDHNWRISEINLEEPGFIDISNFGQIKFGQSVGDDTQSVFREMIRETIREHLKKEKQLRGERIKVLSLFFIDKVANYLDYDDEDNEIEGVFAQWFDELLEEELAKSEEYQKLLPYAAKDLRKAYFSVMRRGGKDRVVDSSERGNQQDNDAFDLIMRNKAQLLSHDEPVRFIFSHSALREGWDNPNIFQICVLREMGGMVERRQTIGRGLRLPVNSEGVRVTDNSIAQLTIIANESYKQFADTLQKEYQEAGIVIGRVRKEEFSKIVAEDENLAPVGSEKSAEIWQFLKDTNIIDMEGRVLDTFEPERLFFELNLPEEFQPYRVGITQKLAECRMDRFVKHARKRKARRLNKAVVWSKDFEEFWYRIAKRTTYRVKLSRKQLIDRVVDKIYGEDPIKPLRIEVGRTGLTIKRGGVGGGELGQRFLELKNSYDLPNLIKEIQEETNLTRKTIVEIVQGSKRIGEFTQNPNDFIQMIIGSIKAVLSEIVLDGIQYEEIEGYIYELRELQEDGELEKQNFIDQMYKVKNVQKTVFDHIVFDSQVENSFAALLDSREDVKLYLKLPEKFRVPTPVGDYNPDWAIVKQENGQEKIYMIRETKSTQIDEKLRSTEVAKIRCGKRHFEAIGINDFSKSSPDNWRL